MRERLSGTEETEEQRITRAVIIAKSSYSKIVATKKQSITSAAE
jgi:hypothetical protein